MIFATAFVALRCAWLYFPSSTHSLRIRSSPKYENGLRVFCNKGDKHVPQDKGYIILNIFSSFKSFVVLTHLFHNYLK